MKLFVKLMFAAIFIAVLLPFTVLKGKDGRPLMSFDNLKMPSISLPETPDVKPVLPATEGMAGKDIVYQWRDAEGSLNFTTEPPPAGVEYTVKGYDPRTNLIQSVEAEPEAPEPGSMSESERNDSDQVQDASDVGNPYSPEKIQKLFKDAKNVEKLLNDRMKQQEAMIGQ
jgi:hypothetical protein